MEVKIPSREHITRLHVLTLILRKQIEERDAHHVKGVVVQIHQFVQGAIRPFVEKAIRDGSVAYVNEDSYSAAGWPDCKRLSWAMVNASALALVIDGILAGDNPWPMLQKEADKIAAVLAIELDLRVSESITAIHSPTTAFSLATACPIASELDKERPICGGKMSTYPCPIHAERPCSFEMPNQFPSHDYFERLKAAAHAARDTLRSMTDCRVDLVRAHPHFGRLSENVDAINILFDEWRHDQRPIFSELRRVNGLGNPSKPNPNEKPVIDRLVRGNKAFRDAMREFGDSAVTALLNGCDAVVFWTKGTHSLQSPIQVHGYFATAYELLNQPPLTVRSIEPGQTSLDDETMQVQDTADKLGVTISHVYRLIKAGKIKTHPRTKLPLKSSVDAYRSQPSKKRNPKSPKAKAKKNIKNLLNTLEQ